MASSRAVDNFKAVIAQFDFTSLINNATSGTCVDHIHVRLTNPQYRAKVFCNLRCDISFQYTFGDIFTFSKTSALEIYKTIDSSKLFYIPDTKHDTISGLCF